MRIELCHDLHDGLVLDVPDTALLRSVVVPVQLWGTNVLWMFDGEDVARPPRMDYVYRPTETHTAAGHVKYLFEHKRYNPPEGPRRLWEPA